MDVSSRSSNKNDAKKPFIAKMSDNHIPGVHATGAYTPYSPNSILYNSINILRE